MTAALLCCCTPTLEAAACSTSLRETSSGSARGGRRCNGTRTQTWSTSHSVWSADRRRRSPCVLSTLAGGWKQLRSSSSAVIPHTLTSRDSQSGKRCRLSRHKRLSSLQCRQHNSLELINAALCLQTSDLQLLEMLSNSRSHRQNTEKFTENLPPTGSTKKL